jgi:hypothetical protein
MPAPTKAQAELFQARFFIRRICPPPRPFSSEELCHNQTDPLPTQESVIGLDPRMLKTPARRDPWLSLDLGSICIIGGGTFGL